MGFYLTISLATLIIVLLTIRIWQKTHCVAFVLGIAFMYYWSLWGAWAVIWSGGELDTYLYYKMFPVALDRDYFAALVLYATFIITVQLTVLWRAKPVAVKPETRLVPISHIKIICVAAVAGVLGYLLVRDSVSLGLALAGSAYKTVRDSPGYTVYELLLNFSMFPSSIGLAVWLCGKDAKYLVGKSSIIALTGYAGVIGGQLLLCMMVGNRGEIVVCFVVMGLFYLANARHPRMLLLSLLALTGGATLSIVKMMRDHTLGSGGDLQSMVWEGLKTFFASTETLSAHFSLYGVLHKHVPLTGGTSFVSLFCSVIPRGVWPGRPDPIYTYYVGSVGALEGQGYTIHHGTGWYLNFGVPGLVLGAALLGLLWVELYNRFEKAWRRQGISHLYSVIGFWMLTAGLPAVLRDGPEVYKQIVFEYSLGPLLVLTFAASTVIIRKNRPSLAIARGVRSHSRALSLSQ